MMHTRTAHDSPPQEKKEKEHSEREVFSSLSPLSTGVFKSVCV